MTVNISTDVMLDMLMERVMYWTEDSVIIKLFERYYDNLIFNGVFEYGNFDPMIIVDNDYINWTRICDENEMKEEEIPDERVLAYYDGYYLVEC